MQGEWPMIFFNRQDEKDDLTRVSQVFPKIHPGMSISWHAWIHIVTKSASIDRSIFGSDEDDTSLLPLFPGEAGEGEEQNKEIGQPLSLKTNFHILKGDVLLFYKSVEIS